MAKTSPSPEKKKFPWLLFCGIGCLILLILGVISFFVFRQVVLDRLQNIDFIDDTEFFQNLSDLNEDSDTQDEVTLPTPGTGEKLFEYETEYGTFNLIIPEDAIIQEDSFEVTSFFWGNLGDTQIIGDILPDAIMPDSTCSNYTDLFLSTVEDPRDGYTKLTHSSGAVACVWEGIDFGNHAFDMTIYHNGIGYNLRMDTAEANGPINVGERLNGFLTIGNDMPGFESFDLIFEDGFESGDTSAWSTVP